jgi:hypothetical protein
MRPFRPLLFSRYSLALVTICILAAKWMYYCQDEALANITNLEQDERI